MSQYADMTYAKKKKLVSEIYFKDKKRKEFYACKDGRYKSYNPQFIAPSERLKRTSEFETDSLQIPN